jgi:toxin-antitoxin system PIN domain toxin
MIYLLDINVLIALADTHHPYHSPAVQFFEKHAVREGWASCPLTQNGFLRIFGLPNYPNGVGSPTMALPVLKSMLTAPGHQFWPDSISLTDPPVIKIPDRPKQLTDCYLLALAASKGGQFATFDKRIDPSFVKGGEKAILTLGSGGK